MHTNVSVLAKGSNQLTIGIGSYIKQLEDYQNRTDGIVGRVQVVSQDAGDAADADEYFVPAIVAQMQTLPICKNNAQAYQKASKISGKSAIATVIEIVNRRFAPYTAFAV